MFFNLLPWLTEGKKSVFIEASMESSQWWASKDGDIHELFASRFVCISIFGVGFVDLDENMANTGLCKKKKKKFDETSSSSQGRN